MLKVKRILKSAMAMVLAVAVLFTAVVIFTDRTEQNKADAAISYYFENAAKWAQSYKSKFSDTTAARLVCAALAADGNDPDNLFGSVSYGTNDSVYNQIKSVNGVSEVSSPTKYSIFKGKFKSTGNTVIGFYIDDQNVVYLSNSTGKSATKTKANFLQYIGTITNYLKLESGTSETVSGAEDVGDNFDAFIICPGNNATTAGKALTLNSSAYSYKASANKDDNPAGRNVYGDAPNFTNTRQIWHFEKQADGTYFIYCIDNHTTTGKPTKFYLNLQSNVNGNTTTSGTSGSYWNVVGWSGEDVTACQYRYYWKISKYEDTATHTDANGASINNGGLPLYYIKSVGTIKAGKSEETDKDKVKINLEVGTTQIAGNLANAHLWNTHTYSDAFYIYKINTISSGSTVQMTSCGDDGLSLGATDLKCTANITDWSSSDLSNQAWIFDRVGTSVPARYTIRSEKLGTYLSVDDYGRGSPELKAYDSSNPTQFQWMLLGHSTRGLSSVSLVPVCAFDTGTPITEACSSADKSSSYGNKDKVLRVVNMDTSTGVCSTDNFNLSNNQFFSLSSIRVNLGNFVSPIKTSINVNYGLSLLDKENDTQPNTGYDRLDPTNGRAIVLRQIAKQSAEPSAPDSTAADEQWHFELDSTKGENVYKIVNGGNGKLLTVKGGIYDKRTEVGVENDGGDNSRWYIYRDLSTTSNGYYSLLSYGNLDYALDVQSGSVPLASDKHMEIWPFSVGVNRLFAIDPTNTARNSRNYAETSNETFWAYIGTKAADDNYLRSPDTSALSTTGGTDITFTKCNNEAEKRKQEYTWKFEPNPDGSYVITSSSATSNITASKGKLLMFTNDAANNKVNLNTSAPPGLDKNFYITPYTGADGKTYYTISAKDNGRMACYSSGTLTSVFDTESTTIPDTYLFTIEKTDLTVSADMPNVEMHLFNYGYGINSASDRVLQFFNGSPSDKQKYVDYNTKIESGDFKPTMKATLGADGFPVVLNNNETNANWQKKDENGNIVKDENNNPLGLDGSLKYLFDPNMGSSTNGFVQGNGSWTSYDNRVSGTTNYQSQHFTVNNPASLFRKSTKGVYYYDSIANAAYFKRDTDASGNPLYSGNFQLFDYTFSIPNASSTYKYKAGTGAGDGVSGSANDTATGINAFNGNFFPFNKAHEEGTLSYGDAAITRPKVRQTASNKNNGYIVEGDYVPANYSHDGVTPLDCWFGMTLTAEFEQAKGGYYEGEPIKFNFMGDDDVWVYMDDVLVLDIGGTHRSLKGWIDFSTGDVQDYSRDPTDGLASGVKNPTKNLKELYKNSGLYDDDYIKANFTGNTYTAGTKHTLKFFYLERGGGASYCKINFNLPKGEPIVTKEVPEKYITEENKDCYYKFQLTAYKSTNSQHTYAQSEDEIMKDASGNPVIKYFDEDENIDEVTYTIQDENGAYHNGNDIRSDGTFYLKAGQTAYFHGIDDNICYKIIEDDYPNIVRAYNKTAIVDSAGNVIQTLTVDDVGYDKNPATVDENGNPTGYYKYTVNKDVIVKTSEVSAEYSYLDNGSTKTTEYSQGSTVTTITDNPQHFTFTNPLGNPTRTISGYAWVVKETDGVLSNRKYISGMTVELYDTSGNLVSGFTTTTNSDGYYQLNNVPSGEYEVRFKKDKVSYDGITEYVFSDSVSVLTPGVETSTNWQSKEASQNLSSAYINADKKLQYAYLTVDMPTGSAIAGIDNLSQDQQLNMSLDKANLTYKKLYRNAGFVISTPTKVSISGKTWIDINYDGMYDSSEKPLSGVKVALQKQETVRVFTSSDGDPFFEFSQNMLDSITADKVSKITVIASGINTSDEMQMFYKTTTTEHENLTKYNYPFHPDYCITASSSSVGSLTEFTLDPSTQFEGRWTGTLEKMRLDPMGRSSDGFTIDFVTFYFTDGTSKVFDTRTDAACKEYFKMNADGTFYGENQQVTSKQETKYIDYCYPNTTTPMTALTDGNGYYCFDNLPAGVYSVKFTDGTSKISNLTASPNDDGKHSKGKPDYTEVSDTEKILNFTLISGIGDGNQTGVVSYTDNDSGFAYMSKELPSSGGTGKAIYFIIGAMLALPLLVFSGVRLRKRLSVKRRYSKQPYIRH